MASVLKITTARALIFQKHGLSIVLAWMGLVFIGLVPQGFGQDASIWATGCTEKVQDRHRAQPKHDGIWDTNSKTVRLAAVRGEHVPFQIIVSTTSQLLEGVGVKVSAFRSKNDMLASEACKLYLLHLVNVYAATEDQGQRGRWPDALVPLTRPFDMRFFWHSQRVNHQSIWVDLKVPADQPAGNYSGKLTVVANNAILGQINVELTVHDIVLPEERHFPVHIGLYENQIARMHGLTAGSEEFQTIFKNYLRFFLNNRIDPRTSPGFKGRIENGRYQLTWTRPDLEELFLTNGRRQFLISPVPDGIRRPSNDQPFEDSYQLHVRQHVTQIIDHAKQNGWYDRLGFHIPVDEPNTAEEYRAVRRWADVVKSVDSKIPIAVTEQPDPEDPAWGTLAGHINAWIINGNYLFSDAESIKARGRAGDQLMWYMSCDQLYPQPNFYIDRHAADPRMVPWISWRYRMSGILYWNAAYWGEIQNPWLDPVTWKTIPCNLPAAGEGSLIYPGNMVQRYTGQENVSGPIGSMRLALLREGLEELELLRMLGELGGGQQADEIVSSICRDIRDFARDPNAIDQARQRLIQEILNHSR